MSKGHKRPDEWMPPDDLDDVILGKMVKEAGMFYKMELERMRG